jgi:hypothetical protein
MKSHRIIIHLSVLLAATSAALPASAMANSLLSGYGGPGQGNQAILGSALLNGPKGGGGSGGSGSSSSEAGTAASTTTGSDTESASRGSGASVSRGNGSSGSRHRSARHAADKSGHATTTPVTPASFYPAAERIPSGAQDGTLGLSGADFLYIVLAVGVLVSLGLLTRRIGAVTEREGHGS